MASTDADSKAHGVYALQLNKFISKLIQFVILSRILKL